MVNLITQEHQSGTEHACFRSRQRKSSLKKDDQSRKSTPRGNGLLEVEGDQEVLKQQADHERSTLQKTIKTATAQKLSGKMHW